MRIIHVCRTAVGGVGRHVADQIRGQHARGHDIGLVCEDADGGAITESLIAGLKPCLSLGLKRIPIPSMPGARDWRNYRHMVDFARGAGADVIHGHGAKGGVYARLAARRLGLASVYTPHGGSLYYQWRSPAGATFLAAEKALRVRRSGLVFVCDYERRMYDWKVGVGGLPYAIAYNGLTPDDFTERELSASPADFFFVGRMAPAKGVDVLLRALGLIPAATRPRVALIGDGPEFAQNRALAQSLGLNDHVQFLGEKPMREAMALGRIMVVPSRNESFPYVVLEAVAAGIPTLATSVGGIGEVLPYSQMVAANLPGALAAKLLEAKEQYPSLLATAAQLRVQAQSRFSVSRMVETTLEFYDRLQGE